MLNISFGPLATTAIAIGFLFLGRFLVKKVKFLQKYYIPAAVVGGLICALIIFALNFIPGLNITLNDIKTGNIKISNFEAYKDIIVPSIGEGSEAINTINSESINIGSITIQKLMMNFFFTTVGFMASLKDLKKGGIGVVVFLLVATCLIACQNLAGVLLAKAFGVDSRYGLLCGSCSYTGGHGTVNAFAGTWETVSESNPVALPNAVLVGSAAATLGLIFGGLLGGPLARLIFKTKHIENTEANAEVSNNEVKENKIEAKKIAEVVFIILICMGLAEYLEPFFTKFLKLISNNKLSLPNYVLAMLLAAITRNILEGVFHYNVPVAENDLLGDVALQIFLALALCTLNINQVLKIDPNVIGLFVTSFFAQIIITVVFIYFVTYNVMKLIVTPYDANVICAGHTGFGMGATPTAIANMDAFCKINGKSTKAYLIVPIVGAMFIDFTNAILISLFAML